MIFLFFLGGKFGGKFVGFFQTHQIKAQGKFRSIFREKFRASKTLFRANFVRQTCRSKISRENNSATRSPCNIEIFFFLLEITMLEGDLEFSNLWALKVPKGPFRAKKVIATENAVFCYRKSI